MNRTAFLKTHIVWLAGLIGLCAATAAAETLTMPLDERPRWVREEGIVMAGSWEPLLFRVRRDGAPGYTPTSEQRADYLAEHSPDTTARLKRMGVNFIMMHCYKGAGLKAEGPSMQEAVRFAKQYHDAGLRVGVYNFSGAFLWEPFFKEMPQAEQWVLLDEAGNKRTYGGATYRYRWNRNHPDAQVFYRKLVRFAVEEIKTDLLHFDNYTYGPGTDAVSVQRFRQYLRDTFSPAMLERAGVTNLETARPPAADSPDLLRRAWQEFCCRSLAESYHQMSRYARSLRSDVLVECNPGGPGNYIHVPVDHGRLLQGGEAFWDEGREPGYHGGKLYTRIRTYKVARAMNNMAFCYTTSPLAIAESMAFNLDCLGAICWFEYNKIVARPGSREPVDPALTPFIRFFHNRRDLLAEAEVVADVAVLRNFASQVLADPEHRQLTNRVEQTLIDNCCPFQIIYDHQLNDLRRYRAVVLAGCVALADDHIAQIRQYVADGGRLCVIGPVATHNPWIVPRKEPPLDDLPAQRVVVVPSDGDHLAAIRQACSGELSLSVRVQAEPKDGRAAPDERPPTTAGLPDQGGLCAELTEKSDKRMVHLVNYRDEPMKQVMVRVRLPDHRKAKSVVLASPEHEADVKLPFEQQGACVRFTVPRVGVYEIAVVAMQ